MCKRSVRRIKHFHLGIDTWREGLEPIPRRDCEQRTGGSWIKRTEKCGETSWKWDLDSDEISIISVTSLTYGLRLLTRYVLKLDPSIPPDFAKLRKNQVFHWMVGHSSCKWQLYSDVVYKVLYFRHSFFFIPGIT